MLSHWQTTYQADCSQNTGAFQKSVIPGWFKKDYHTYHKTIYKTDHTQSIGIYGDNPSDKFTRTVRNGTVDKFFFDNQDVAEGSTKMSNFIPGYSGFIPKDYKRPNETAINDPLIKYSKTNHLLNYKLRIPYYSGHIPLNAKNHKGNARPFCLSTQGEKFS